MILPLLFLLSCEVAQAPSSLTVASVVPRQDRSSEIADLLKQLAPGVIEERNGVLILGPSAGVVERVRNQLILITTESLESRSAVIRALTAILNNPKSEWEVVTVSRWRIAVALLGDLKATEAIGDLIRNLDHTGVEGSPVRHPVVRTALVHIGQPAIAPLLSALSDSNQGIRREASEALGEIGSPAVEGLLNALSNGGPAVRAGAVVALSRIGGARARSAIETAIGSETDENVKKELGFAVVYMNHMESLKRHNRL